MSETAELYAGRLDDFTARRDALAKQMRAEGDRDRATSVKAIRKPSRSAWALNVATSSDAYADLVSTMNATIAAQAKGGDVRGAMAGLRNAVRVFASHAADNAHAQGQNVDANTLSTGVLAILGDPHAFQLLQRGELADVPEAGGLDILATMTAAPTLVVSSHEKTSIDGDTASNDDDAAVRRTKKAAEDIARAEARLADHRKVSDQALRALNVAEAALDAAQRRFDDARKGLAIATTARDNARALTEQASRRMGEVESETAGLHGSRNKTRENS